MNQDQCKKLVSMSSSGIDSKQAASGTAADSDRPTSADVNKSSTVQSSATSSTAEQHDVALRYAVAE